MNSKIKAVIFDLDNTLYDNKSLPFRLIISLPTDFARIAADRKVRKDLKGMDFKTPEKYKEEYSKRMAHRTNIKPKDALNWYSNRYMGTMSFLLKKYYPVRPKVHEVISFLNEQKIKISIFSDYPRVKQRIKALDFSHDEIKSIHGIYSAEDFGSQKPAVRPFLEIAQNLKVNPQNILVVGDRDDTDGEGARLAGMNYIQIATHKTKVIDPNHPVWSWAKFAEWVLNGMKAF